MNENETAEETAETNELTPADLRFIYFGREKGATKHNGVTCVGYQIIEDATEGAEEDTINLSFCFCSPLDSFSRKKARMAITGRINSEIAANVAIAKNIVPTYEVVTNTIRDFINEALPDADFADVKAVAVAANFNPEEHPTIAGVNLPWWFKGV